MLVLEFPHPLGKGHWGGQDEQRLAVVKYIEYPAWGLYFQRYSIGGSSNAAFHCQYLISLLTAR